MKACPKIKVVKQAIVVAQKLYYLNPDILVLLKRKYTQGI